MKIHRDFFLVCENFIVDQQNRITIINAFNDVNGTGVPMLGPKFVIAFAFRVELDDSGEEVIGNLSIKTPSGREMSKAIERELNHKKTTDEQILGGAFAINSPVFPEFGPYKITLKLNGKVAASRSLHVKKAKG
jgi:hypothetical protein